MSNKLKGFAKDSVVYGAGEAVSKIGSIILVPILSRLFLPGDYGIIDLLSLSYGFVREAISLNMYTGLQKFFYLKEGEDRKNLLSSVFFFRFLLSSLCAVIIIVFSSHINILAFGGTDYSAAIILLAILLPFDDVFIGLMLLLRLKRSAVVFSIFSVIQVIILPICTYVCVVHLHFGIVGVFLAKLISTLITILPMFLIQRREFSQNIISKYAIDVTKFSVPGLPGAIIMDIMNIIPRYLLAFFSTLTAVGIFGMADRIANIVLNFRSAFNLAWNPFAFANMGKPDERYLYEKVFKTFGFMLISVGLFTTLFAKEALIILTPPTYYSAAPLVGGLSFYHAVRALDLVFYTGLYSVNRVSHTSLLEAVKLFAFAASAIILIPNYGAIGLVVSLDIAIVIFFICYAFTIKRHFPFSFSLHRISFMLAIAIMGSAFTMIHLVSDKINLDILFLKSIFMAIYVIIGYFIIFTRNERISVQNKIRTFWLSQS